MRDSHTGFAGTELRTSRLGRLVLCQTALPPTCGPILDYCAVIFLVRHAHADCTPGENRPLSERGREDADRVADLLQHCPISALHSSPFRRARQTIGPLAARLDLPVHALLALCERRLGGGPVADFYAAVEATWRDPSFAHAGGESNSAAQQRGAAVIRRLLERHAGEHIVLSTHGNLLALTLQTFDASIDFAFWKSLTMPDIYQLGFTDAGTVAIRRLWHGSETRQKGAPRAGKA